MSSIYNKRRFKNKLTSIEFENFLWNNKRAGTLVTSLPSVSASSQYCYCNFSNSKNYTCFYDSKNFVYETKCFKKQATYKFI